MIEFVTGDCVKTLRDMAVSGALKFDVVVTSPPYNLGIDYRSGVDDLRSRQDYSDWSAEWLSAVRDMLSTSGSLFLNVAGKPTNPLVPFDVLRVALQVGWRLQNTLYWIKSLAHDQEPCEGHVKPLNSPRFVNDAVEHIFHLTLTGEVPIDRLAVGVPYADLANLKRDKRGKNGNVRCRGNAIFIPYKTIQSRSKDRPHPATFPVELPEYCFRLHGVSRAWRTLDPFSGLGSTARAAQRLGLDHVGIELSDEDNQEARRLLVKDSVDAF